MSMQSCYFADSCSALNVIYSINFRHSLLLISHTVMLLISHTVMSLFKLRLITLYRNPALSNVDVFTYASLIIF